MPKSQTTHPEVPAPPEEFAPGWSVHPGALIQREIEAAGYSQTAVAARTNISAKHLNQLLRGHVALSAEVAVALERVLDSPGDLWLRMDATWQASRSRATARERLGHWTSWLHHFPADVLIERGIWHEKQSAPERVDALLSLFGVVSPDAFETVWLRPQANFRRSQKFEIDAYSTAVWLRFVDAAVETASSSIPPYDEIALREAVKKFPHLTRLTPTDGVAQAKRLLMQAGVVFVIEPEVGNTRICGVSRWSGLDHPVIALTGRQKYLDILWFTLLHEIGHVLMHPKRSTFLELDTPGAGRAADDEDAQESAADNFAANALLEPQFRSSISTLHSAADLMALAAEAGVGVSIVAGRYGHETQDWARFGKHRARIDAGRLWPEVRSS